MNKRFERFTKLMMTAKPTDFNKENGVIHTKNSFDFELVDKSIVENDVFSFDNIDDFESMIKDFDRGIDFDLVLNVLNDKLSIKNINPNSKFNLRIITS